MRLGGIDQDELMYSDGMSSPGTLAPPPWVRLAAHPLRWRLMTALAGSDLRVRELVRLVEEPQNLVSYHLRLLRTEGLVSAGRSSFDRRDSYYHLHLDRCAQALRDAGSLLHPALGCDPPDEISSGAAGSSVLFLCTGNSARSPMAEALLRRRTASTADVASAGSHPRLEVHPAAVRVLRDDWGIDIAGQRPRHVDDLRGRRFDHVVTLCDRVREVCPELRGAARTIHWSIPDPSGAPDGDDAFRRTATALDLRIRYLLPTLTHPQEVRP